MPTYTIPNFNVLADWWQPGNSPGAGSPVDATPMVQLYGPTRTIFTLVDAAGDPAKQWTPIEIRTKVDFANPIGTPYVRSIFGLTDPLAVQWYYLVTWWDYMHLDFPNVYIMLHCLQCDDFGVILPSTR